jgi:endo-1,3(4)-beta-glucanase
MTIHPFGSCEQGIPDVFPRKPHPLDPLDVTSGSIQTNKFYTNFLLDKRTQPAYVHPYSVWWSQTPELFGLAVSHTTEQQRVFGHDPNANPAQFYFNPVGIQSVNFGAVEFTPDRVSMSADSFGPLSVNINLTAGLGQLNIPLASGIGMISGIYTNLTPVIQSLVGFQYVEACSFSGMQKFRLTLFNGVTWLMYVSSPVQFCLKDNNHFVASAPVATALVQIGSCPSGCEDIYDSTAGAIATRASLGGFVSDSAGTYRIQYEISGNSRSGKALIYALPHQVESFSVDMQARQTHAQLDSTVMGKMVGCITDVLEMVEEDLPTYIGFLPWSRTYAFDANKFNSADLDLLQRTAIEELNQDIQTQTNLDSMYFSGKALDKFAFILLVTKYVLCDDDLTKYGLEKLKSAFAVFSSNQQKNPLVYDTFWKGIVSSGGYSDPNADFGNTYYNDHHFHYGYFYHAAAVIGQIDRDFGGCWIDQNKNWVNALVRDTANYGNDSEFPISRSFDWFVGHSWAKGLFVSADGKDEESSSEDYHFAYGIKMWGQVIGNQVLESRGNLMLAVMKRAMNKYMLYSSDNCEQPKNIVGNKVSGILFENKVDHATYFGLNPEYIHGIHMIPITPVSSYVRSPQFVKEEWESILVSIVDGIDSGWKGILKLNQSLYDPYESYRFFSADGFRAKWLDGGMSRTWALAFAKGLA